MAADWTQSKRLGLMGGTFNPIHVGHLRMAEEFAERYELDQVLLIPCAQPVHRDEPEVSADDRLQMVELSCSLSRKLTACDVELKVAENGESNYTVDTLELISAALSDEAKLFFLMGTDAYSSLNQWKKPKRLIELAELVVVNRAREQLQARPEWLENCENEGRVHLDDFSYLDISSTDIRKRIYNKLSIRFLVPDLVEKFISEKQLYRDYD